MEKSFVEYESKAFDELVGKDVFELVFTQAPSKVRNRIGSALRHYSKASKLIGIDEEMGVIRLIAAEEELVVAIFEWLKLNKDTLPEHDDFITKFKNHQVKLAFQPVLSHIGYILESSILSGITLPDVDIDIEVEAVLKNEKVRLQLWVGKNRLENDLNPLDIRISEGERSDQEVDELIFQDFKELVKKQTGMSLKEFLTHRADFRNKLLYAEDGQVSSMDDSLESLIKNEFSKSMRNLLWCLGALLTNKPTARQWGVVSQFISVYRRALVEAKIIKPNGVANVPDA